MTPFRIAIALLIFGTLTACGKLDTVASAPPPPQPITVDAVGHYCGMNLTEHVGPKGQILLNDREQPVWFTTIKQLFAYTLLPEEPKGIRALYVNDMGRMINQDQPEVDTWIDARKAFYVIESAVLGGMSVEDAMPFSDLAQAQEFANKNNGRIVRFDEMPENYILNYDDAAQTMNMGN
ncbi:nitrous oxide reductase accessory protein NosL [Alcaligenaceae bacterium CGII-47]|nr:nitrous oxide reductase accessory protein NosL [Alcaligenaceae bacterium CGII-47]